MATLQFDSAKLRKIAEFVSAAQGKLEKLAAVERELAVRAPQVVDQLIEQGVLSQHMKQATVKAFSNPVEILATLKKTASLVSRKPLGEGSNEQQARRPETANDAFARHFLG
jgi:hypothetical protein